MKKNINHLGNLVLSLPQKQPIMISQKLLHISDAILGIETQLMIILYLQHQVSTNRHVRHQDQCDCHLQRY